MNIAVIGGTGLTGQYFIEQALANSHHVTALVRSPEKVAKTHPQLTLVKGDVYNTNDVRQVISDQDAVFIALGTGKYPKKSSIRTDGTRQVVNVLHNLKQNSHLVILSSLGVGDSKKHTPLRWFIPLKALLFFAFADHYQQEKLVKISSLPWTILRPTFMEDEPPTRQIQAHLVTDSIRVTPSVTRADVASFALNIIEQNSHLHQALTLTAA